jgi:hypothetical protein
LAAGSQGQKNAWVISENTILRSTFKRIWWWAAIAGFILLILAIYPIDVFTLRLPKYHLKQIAAIRISQGQEVVVAYRHSVERTRVEGRFRIGPGPALYAHETRMASVGTGLPNSSPGKTRRDGEWFIVDEGLTKLEDGLRFYLSPVNHTRVIAAGQHINLEKIKAGSIIQLDVERIRLIKWLLWRFAGISWLTEIE